MMDNMVCQIHTEQPILLLVIVNLEMALNTFQMLSTTKRHWSSSLKKTVALTNLKRGVFEYPQREQYSYYSPKQINNKSLTKTKLERHTKP